MTDYEVLIEYCERFGHDYTVDQTDDGETIVYTQYRDYYFDEDGTFVDG